MLAKACAVLLVGSMLCAALPEDTAEEWREDTPPDFTSGSNEMPGASKTKPRKLTVKRMKVAVCPPSAAGCGDASSLSLTVSAFTLLFADDEAGRAPLMGAKEGCHHGTGVVVAAANLTLPRDAKSLSDL